MSYSYSRYAKKGDWSLSAGLPHLVEHEDYGSFGFAHIHTVKKFALRATAAFELFEFAKKKFKLPRDFAAEIFDFGAATSGSHASQRSNAWVLKPNLNCAKICRAW